MEPVDPSEAPDYYELIKDPMGKIQETKATRLVLICCSSSVIISSTDLQQIEKRINSKGYSTLSEFIADMTKIFDNCRFYNSKESAFYRCAESLEAYFVQKIKSFRENIVDNKMP